MPTEDPQTHTASASCSATASGRRSCPPPSQVLDAALGGRRRRPARLGTAAGRRRRDREHGSALPPVTLETLDELDGWLLGPHDSAAYPEPHPAPAQPERVPPQALRPVRQHPPGEGVRGRQGRGARHRPGHRPGEHRGLLRRPQHVSPAPASSCRRRTWRSRMGIFTRPAIERIARAAFELARRRRKQADHRAQGQRAQADHRPVPRRLPRGRRGLPGRRRSTTSTSTR